MTAKDIEIDHQDDDEYEDVYIVVETKDKTGKRPAEFEMMQSTEPGMPSPILRIEGRLYGGAWEETIGQQVCLDGEGKVQAVTRSQLSLLDLDVKSKNEPERSLVEMIREKQVASVSAKKEMVISENGS